MSIPPVPCLYDGETFIPCPRFAKLCDREFVIGETYPLIVEQQRSSASHSHYFAALSEAWKNLPEAIADEYPTAEHLRKRMLIRAHYADERSIVCASAAEALRIAAFVRPFDEYAVVVVRGAVVKVFTAQSQSKKAMGGPLFQKSKTDVLDLVSGLLGVAPEALSSHARAA